MTDIDTDQIDSIDLAIGRAADTIERFGAACNRADRLGSVLIISVPAGCSEAVIDEARAMSAMYGMPLFDTRHDHHDPTGSTA